MGFGPTSDGNLWSSVGWAGPGTDGVHCLTPEGELIGRIVLPEPCANLCFGGVKRNRLFMTASQSLYSLYVEAIGASGRSSYFRIEEETRGRHLYYR